MRLDLLAILVVGTLASASAAATFLDLVPAQSMEHPQGVSLRESSQRGHFFVPYYAGRAHRGGGLRGGK